tara:strand:- start:138 stop:575 length:438 start_codon:yes stop_codon:yes gene_type:complete
MTSLRSGVKFSSMSYYKMGIYINQPRVDNLKIIYNKRDAAKVKDPSKILRVNKDNIKFGKSKNLDARHREYKEIFGENTNFKIVIQIDNYEKLVNFENHLKKVFEPFCLRSPSNGVQMEWMEKISFMDAENTIKEEYKRKDATFK